MNLRLALRSVLKNRWRSALTAGGIAVGVALIVWLSGISEAMLDVMVRGATSAQLGQVQVHDVAYAEKPGLHDTLADDDAALAALRGLPGVEGAARRVHGYGLIGHETRSQVARIVGVEAAHEPRVTTVVKGLVAGDWLSEAPPAPPAPREVVLGDGLARLLDVAVGDELVVLLQGADGSLGNDLLTVRGVIKTGNEGLDRSAAWMHKADAQFVMALEGRVHEVALQVTRDASPEAVRDAARRALSGGAPLSEAGVAVRTWKEIVPELHQVVELSRQGGAVMYLFVFVIAALGILNAQRMSALERRREFGVLIAIGTEPRRLFAQVVLEAVALSLLGGLAGAGFGVALTAWHGSAGFDMASFSQQQGGFSYMGVSFAERLYPVLDWAAVVPPVVAVAVVGVLCGLWPALDSARLDAVRAISGRS